MKSKNYLQKNLVMIKFKYNDKNAKQMTRRELKIMKKILKKEVIIAFIIGIILASSIAVYAYSYAAKDVGYTKPGENTPIDVETALNDLYSKSKLTLLWTNANPNSSFEAQTISLDLSSYKYIAVVVNTDTGEISFPRSTSIIPVGQYNNCRIIGTLTTYYRDVAATIAGVSFSTASNPSVSSNNNKCIPYKIYGIKNDLNIELQ